MNDDKPTDEIKSLFAEIKILATKVNDDKENRKKKLEETKKSLRRVNRNIKNCFINTIL